MNTAEMVQAACKAIEDLELADAEEDAEYYRALVADEAFGAACYRCENTGIYAQREDATDADSAALEALECSVHQHAQRVKEELDE